MSWKNIDLAVFSNSDAKSIFQLTYKSSRQHKKKMNIYEFFGSIYIHEMIRARERISKHCYPFSSYVDIPITCKTLTTNCLIRDKLTAQVCVYVF